MTMTVEEQWHQIRDFPDYSVSDYGRIRNDHTDRIMRLSRTQRGQPIVGLVRNGVQHKRAVSRLVAEAFCPRPIAQMETHDTPINLDGDRDNNCAANLLWRPSWFAVKYHQQFRTISRLNKMPRIRDTKTGEIFDDMWIPIMRWGLLYNDIVASLVNHTVVWPTMQRFEWFEA